ncbi:HIT family protein [Massilia agilis]|uniref:HIT family protein n=1 Tax=Massilia agilis TaxID=1811226 RepID=A0ABT2DG98_9BURK|nr:HIT family protein [Massilia agilis]MCS0809448.1 HIT family protein [Massilia agilis]
MTKVAGCELCQPVVPPLYRDEKLSVIQVDDPNYPGFCRVIWNEHVKEMSDLPPADRILINDVVWHVETAVREVMDPDKINVASLGNVVPHLHWHVIPRYVDDAHFPNPVWANAVRKPDEKLLAARRALLPRLAAAIKDRLNKR